MGNDEPEAPFFFPFAMALLFGGPVTAIWYNMAEKANLVVSAIAVLLGLACGLGARLAAKGEHPAAAAVIATLMMIVASTCMVTVGILAFESGQTYSDTLRGLVAGADFKAFLDRAIQVPGRTLFGYPFAVYAAYKVSDGT